MAILVMIHVAGEEAVLGEVESLPKPSDNSILVHKVRRRDGKPVHYLAPGVTTVLWPLSRLTFLEVLPVRATSPGALGQSEAVSLAEADPEDPPAASVDSLELSESAPPDDEPVAPPTRRGGMLGQRLGPTGAR